MGRLRRFKLFHFGHSALPSAFMVFAVATAAAVGASGAVTSRAQEDAQPGFERLRTDFEKAREVKDYPKALEVAEKMHEAVQAQYLEACYNLACMHCRLGEKEEAFTWLERAVTGGYLNAFQMREDRDLEPLRKDPRFRELNRKAWLAGYIFMLEREERDLFQFPDRVIEALALKPGERVADVGAGSGYFTVRLARAVGPDGAVWATDLYQELLDHIDRRARKERLENVKTLKVEKDDPGLPEGGIDTIFLVDCYHYLSDRAAYNKKLKACLATGGRVVVIDSIPKPHDERMPIYPKPHVEISRETLDGEMAEAGLAPVKTHDFLPEQYFVEYRLK